MTLRFRHPPAGESDFIASPPVAGETPADAVNRMVKRLARACRSTASFPGAFEPSLAKVSTDAAMSGDEPPDCFLRRNASFSGTSYLIDGGTLVNLPVEGAIQVVFEQRASGEVRRVFAMVVPDPGTAGAAGGAEPTPPSLAKVVTGALSTIPRNQTVGRALDDLKQRNRKLEVVRESRLALLQNHWTALGSTASLMFPAYAVSRLETSRNVLRDHLDVAISACHPPLSSAEAEAWGTHLAGAEIPWIPTTWEGATDDDLNRWGRTTVRRSAARLLHLILTASSDHAPPPEADVVRWRAATSGVIAAMGELSLIGRETNLFHDARLRCPPAEELGRLASGWSQQRSNVAEQLRVLGTVIGELAQVGTGLPGIDELGAGEGPRFFLALEVIESTFKGFAQEIEQRVETVRIDSLATSPLDALQRATADGKAAGVQLGHFGAFLKTSWRANDWMWGRLDGSSDLLAVMLHGVPEERMAQLRAHFSVATDAGVVDALLQRRHAEIVLEETGTIVDSIARDREAGATVSASARALSRAWEAMPTNPPDHIEAARRLLSLNHIGAEVIADDKGSDLLTRVSVTALTTGTSVLRAASPKLLAAPISIVRYVALLAWGMVRSALGGPAGRTLAGLAFGLGAATVAMSMFSSTSLGILTPVGFGLFGAGVLLAFARVPFLLLPVLLLMAVPNALTLLPAEPWTWWPTGWAFPTLHGRGDAISRLAFVLGVVVIGVMRRPAWLARLMDDERRVDRRLQEVVGAVAVPPAT